MSSKLRLSLSLHVSMAGPRDGCDAFARTWPASLPLRAHWGEASQPRARPGTTYIVLSQGGSATDWAHIIQSLMASDFIPLLMRKRFEVRGESQNRRASDAARRAARLPASSARTKQNKTPRKAWLWEMGLSHPPSRAAAAERTAAHWTSANGGGGQAPSIPLLWSLFTAKDRALRHLGNSQQRQWAKL